MLAHSRYGIDKADFHRKETVGGVLNRLGRYRVGDDDRCVNARIKGRNLLSRSTIRCADHHPIRLEKVAYGGAFTQELGVRHDKYVIALENILNSNSRADRHRGLVDHDRTWLQYRRNFTGRLLEIRQIGTPVFILRRRNAQKHDVGLNCSCRRAKDELDTAQCAVFVDEPFEAFLDDRNSPTVEHIDLTLVDVATHYVVTEMGEARTGGQADITGTNYPQPNMGCLHWFESFGALGGH